MGSRVLGKSYPRKVDMTPLEEMLEDYNIQAKMGERHEHIIKEMGLMWKPFHIAEFGDYLNKNSVTKLGTK